MNPTADGGVVITATEGANLHDHCLVQPSCPGAWIGMSTTRIAARTAPAPTDLLALLDRGDTGLAGRAATATGVAANPTSCPPSSSRRGAYHQRRSAPG